MKHRTAIAFGIACLTFAAALAWWLAAATGDPPLEDAIVPAKATPPSASATPTIPSTTTPAPTSQPSPQSSPAASPTRSPVPPPSPGSVGLDQEFELKVGTTASLAGTRWAITLVNLPQDSRCPASVTCVRAGDVTVELVASAPGDSKDLKITVGSGDMASATFNSYRVSVVRVAPIPLTPGVIRQEDYVVSLVVRRDAASTGDTGIRGVVTLGPLCPVVRIGQPCPDKPYEATLLVFDAAGMQVASARSGADGVYAVALPAGAYRVAPQSPLGSMLPSAGEVSVVIPPGAWVVVDISFDTGIR